MCPAYAVEASFRRNGNASKQVKHTRSAQTFSCRGLCCTPGAGLHVSMGVWQNFINALGVGSKKVGVIELIT